MILSKVLSTDRVRLVCDYFCIPSRKYQCYTKTKSVMEVSCLEVSSETIIHKMQHEIERVKQTSDYQERREHISRIKLLCELLLEEKEESYVPNVKEQEVFLTKTVKNDVSVPRSISDDDDGTSIFDF